MSRCIQCRRHYDPKVEGTYVVCSEECYRKYYGPRTSFSSTGTGDPPLVILHITI